MAHYFRWEAICCKEKQLLYVLATQGSVNGVGYRRRHEIPTPSCTVITHYLTF